MPFVCTQQSYSTSITAVTKILQQTNSKRQKTFLKLIHYCQTTHTFYSCVCFFSGLVEGWESRENAVALFGRETKTESRDDRVKTDTLIVTRAQFYSV